MKGFIRVNVQLDLEAYERLKQEAFFRRPSIPLAALVAEKVGSKMAIHAARKRERTVEDLADQIATYLRRKAPKRRDTVRHICKRLRAYSLDVMDAVTSPGSGLRLVADPEQVAGKKRYWIRLAEDIEAIVAKDAIEERLKRAAPQAPIDGMAPEGSAAAPAGVSSENAVPAPASADASAGGSTPEAALPDLFDPSTQIPDEERCPWCNERRKLEGQKTCGNKWCVTYQTEADNNARGEG